ncbi:MAG: iron chelate uptake ABC transporter family permease subunit, partial [Candidatus Bipolaricaulota bacterium]|nr:iron chelate uptake ABC transporter family permease subunit [Candidatus Bipolaricaulota bacterium]
MTPPRRRNISLLLYVLPVALAFVALLFGRYGGGVGEAFRSLFSSETGDLLRSLIVHVRLPRTLAALVVGADLAAAGAVLQGLFRNPLVDSRILGVSSGAAFGACLAILVSGSGVAVQTGAFFFALVAVAIVLAVGWRLGATPLVLLLVGIAASALFDALLGLVKYVADPLSKLPAITYWLLGGLGGTQWSNLAPLLVLSALGLGFLVLARWRLNVLTLSDDEAASLGVRVRPLRVAVVVAASLLVATSVSQAGMIGWIGLVVPHIARAWVGPDHVRLVPASAALGAAILVVLDTVARTALPGPSWHSHRPPRRSRVPHPPRRLPPREGGGTMKLEADRISYAYHRRGALSLRRVSLTVETGEIAFVLGANGSGKSTLLSLLAGMRHPAAGAVRLDGQLLDALAPRERAKRVGVVPQFHDPVF